MKENKTDTHRKHDSVADCIECGLCIRECSFLTRYGSPFSLYQQSAAAISINQSFYCSLCGLCSSLCPLQLQPHKFFQYQRKQTNSSRLQRKWKYRGLLLYEKLGMSPIFSWYGLPANCTTVYFPGCSMPGDRPESTEQMFKELSTIIPNLGIAFDCCKKPSADLGLLEDEKGIFSSHVKMLIEQGVTKIIVNCPSCYVMFDGYKDLEVTTVFDVIANSSYMPATQRKRTITVHDPCRVREMPRVHESVRTLIERMGLEVREMKHHGINTTCCGEGGAVSTVDEELAASWTRKRAEEADGLETITYCGGCVSTLQKGMHIAHLADMMFTSDMEINQSTKISPLSFYRNRLNVKKKLSQLLSGCQSGVRAWQGKVVFK